jgi:hypothetical protein
MIGLTTLFHRKLMLFNNSLSSADDWFNNTASPACDWFKNTVHRQMIGFNNTVSFPAVVM